MLLVLGVGSLNALVNAVATAIWDTFPKLRYWQIVLPISIIGFFLGLLFVTPGGQWLLNLVDYFGGTFLIFVLAIGELVGVFWVYGLENFCNDAEFMLNRHPSCYWKICWGVVTPVLMIVIFIYSMITLEPLTYNGNDYPDGYLSKWIFVTFIVIVKFSILLFLVVGWTLFAIGLCLIPLWAIYLIDIRKPIVSLKRSLKPKKSWGPKSPTVHQDWITYTERKREEKKNVMERRQLTNFQYRIRFLFNAHK